MPRPANQCAAHGLTPAEVHDYVVRSRAAQGLSPKVEDPQIIATIQAIFREALPPYDITAGENVKGAR